MHCLTPSLRCGRVLESLATVYKLSIVVIDVASAHLHAQEESGVFMRPPKEWVTLMGGSQRYFWRMRRSLCDRQTTGATWRDWFGQQICGYEDFRRSQIELAMIVCPSRCLFLAHYVNGARVNGAANEWKDFMKYVEKTMLIKVSDMVVAAQATSTWAARSIGMSAVGGRGLTRST